MNQTALITGASKRIGRAIAKHLALQGWNIAIHFNTSETEAAKFSKDLHSLYPNQRFRIYRANLVSKSEVENLIPFVKADFNKIDLLINNASVFNKGFLKDTSSNLFNSQFNVNLRAPFLLIRDFAKLFNSGNIINLVDTRIINNKSDYSAYSLSKKALWELTKMAALELSPGIRVNAIAPGATLPPEGESNEYLERLAAKIPMKKPVGLEPILQSIDYILANRTLTGQLLFADGGENLGQ